MVKGWMEEDAFGIKATQKQSGAALASKYGDQRGETAVYEKQKADKVRQGLSLEVAEGLSKFERSHRFATTSQLGTKFGGRKEDEIQRDQHTKLLQEGHNESDAANLIARNAASRKKRQRAGGQAAGKKILTDRIIDGTSGGRTSVGKCEPGAGQHTGLKEEVMLRQLNLLP